MTTHRLKTGLCSITFRNLAIEEIVALAQQAGLDAIEWGGDVHVPPGDLAAAEAARQLTESAGLEISSYGSYYKIIDESGNPIPFQPTLDSALALGTDTIRVWAGNRASEAVARPERDRLAVALRETLDAAQAKGVRIALEFHAHTLTDSNAAAAALLDELDHPNLFTYWQPIYWLADDAYRLEGLKRLAPRVINLHAFHWIFNPGKGSWGESTERRPLEEGAEEWARYLSVPLDPSAKHYALMEFVRNDDPSQFFKDAATLKRWVEGR